MPQLVLTGVPGATDLCELTNQRRCPRIVGSSTSRFVAADGFPDLGTPVNIDETDRDIDEHLRTDCSNSPRATSWRRASRTGPG